MWSAKNNLSVAIETTLFRVVLSCRYRHCRCGGSPSRPGPSPLCLGTLTPLRLELPKQTDHQVTARPLRIPSLLVSLCFKFLGRAQQSRDGLMESCTPPPHHHPDRAHPPGPVMVSCDGGSTFSLYVDEA